MTLIRPPPGDFEALQSRIREQHNELSAKLRDIAIFAIDHPDFMALETVAQIAEHANVTPSSLIRFAQAFGYDGFSDMQRVFKTRLFTDAHPFVERALQPVCGNSIDGIVDGFAEAAGESMTKLHSRLDRLALEETAKLLAAAGSIYVVGQRRSFPVAAYIHYGLLSLGTSSQLLDSGAGMSARAMELLSPTDTVLAVSFKPYADATLQSASTAAAHGAVVLGFGDSSMSPLAPHCRLFVYGEDPELGGVLALSSSMLLAAMLLATTGRIKRTGDCPDQA